MFPPALCALPEKDGPKPQGLPWRAFLLRPSLEQGAQVALQNRRQVVVRVKLVLVGDAGQINRHGDLTQKHGGNAKERTVFGCQCIFHPTPVIGEDCVYVPLTFQLLAPARPDEGLIFRKRAFEE